MRITDKKQLWLDEYYRHIDAMDHDAYMAMFADGARMLFANADPIVGKDGIREALTGLLGAIAGIKHIPGDAYEEDGDLVIFECDVEYTRKDGKQVTVRGGCFFVIGDDGLRREQRITVDTTPVFA